MRPPPVEARDDEASDGTSGCSERPPARLRRVSAYAIGLLVAACCVCGGLLVIGARVPPLGAFVLLALPLTVCMNRFVFFANEVGVTAEAATLFAAIVGFRSDSPLLGPLLLALLVGALDGRHWERRVFLRMSYNSGSQALTVLAAAGAFVAVTPPSGSSATALLVASVLAALVYVAVETCCGVALVVMLGERPDSALRHQLPVNALALPLALFGAIVALTVAPTSWWLVGLALVPTAFVPELVLVGMRRAERWWRVREALALAMAGLVVSVVGVLVHGPSLGALVAIVALALLLGADGRPPLRRRVAPGLVIVLGCAAGLAPASWLAGVCAAACGLAVVAVAAGRGPGEAAWLLPLALAGAGVAALVGATALPPAPPLVVGVTAVVAAAATWGALPWGSRFVGPWGARRGRRWAVVVLALVSLSALLSSGWCLVTGAQLARRLAVVAAATALACAAAAVRQWRFAPSVRRRDARLIAAGGIVVATVTVLGTSGPNEVVAVAGVATVAIALGVAKGCVRALPRAGGDAHRRSPPRARVR
jgi:hypothetical protein